MSEFNEVVSQQVQDVTDVPDPATLESLKSEVVEVEDLGEVLVTGDPYELAETLDDCQGDNKYGYGQDCGLVSVANILTMAGIEATEDDIVAQAIVTGRCDRSSPDVEDRGGTTVSQRQALLAMYGVSSDIYSSTSAEGSLEAIASYVENGQGVNMSVNAGYAWDNAYYIDDGTSNHSIVVTGTVRDPETGELLGFTVCDSGLTDEESGANYLSVETLQDAYLNAPGTTVLVTKDVIRE